MDDKTHTLNVWKQPLDVFASPHFELYIFALPSIRFLLCGGTQLSIFCINCAAELRFQLTSRIVFTVEAGRHCKPLPWLWSIAFAECAQLRKPPTQQLMANKMPCVIQKVTQTAFFHGRYDNQNYEHTQSQHNLTSSCVPSRCGFFHHLPGEGVWGCLDFNKGCYWCFSCSSSPSLLPVSSLPVGMLWATPGLDGHIASSGGGGVCLDRTTISRAQGVVEWAWTRPDRMPVRMPD